MPRLSRPARGALAGAVAATVWAAQQPVDMALFGVAYDDKEILATAITDGPAAGPLGWVMHAINGAVFGLAYSLVRERVGIPGSPWARGLTAGLVEHAATWPATALVPRVHPRGRRFPPLWGSKAALAQATWRHVLFGVVLGELESRLNDG